VISSGPYSFVRHPMYLGVGLMYLASPLAWAPIGADRRGDDHPILVARIVTRSRCSRGTSKGIASTSNHPLSPDPGGVVRRFTTEHTETTERKKGAGFEWSGYSELEGLAGARCAS